MIKKLCVLSLVIGCIAPCMAEKVKIDIKPQTKSQGQQQPILRGPMDLPVEVVYDSDAMTIEVSCTTDLEAEVYVYDASEVLEDYSPCLNTVLSVTNADYHTIVIEGDGWSGYGYCNKDYYVY